MDPLLSIIIPAHNEETRLHGTLQRILAFLETQSFSAEVIIVENGSSDRTAMIGGAFAAEHPHIKLITEQKPGKGRAVRRGMCAARGTYRFICDADLSMPIEEVTRFLPPQAPSYDIAIASREVAGAKRYNEPYVRHLIGRAFNLLVRTLAVHSIHDTQCGFKSFHANVVEDLFGVQLLDGWTFDVEVLFIAQRRGYHVLEIPIPWHYFPGSKIHILRDSINMFLDLFRIRRNWRKGLYAPRQ